TKITTVSVPPISPLPCVLMSGQKIMGGAPSLICRRPAHNEIGTRDYRTNTTGTSASLVGGRRSGIGHKRLHRSSRAVRLYRRFGREAAPPQLRPGGGHAPVHCQIG